MANVRTLRDINKGHRLGSMYEEELEKKLYTALKSKTEISDLSEKLQDKYSKQVKDFDRERKGWNRERKQWEIAFSNVTSDKQKLHTYALELIGETKWLKIKNTNLTSENIRKDLSLTKSKAENVTKSKKIKSLESMIKILEGKLSSAQKDGISIQNDSSKKEARSALFHKSEILSLNSKIAELENIKSELESRVNELECLKSENRLMACSAIIGGDVEAVQQGQSSIVSTIKNMQSEELDAPTVNSVVSPQNENVPEFSLHPFLVVRPKKPSLETVVPLKSGEFKDPSIKSSTNALSVQVSTDKSSTSSPPTTQSHTAVNDLRKFSTGSAVIEKDNVDSKERSSMLYSLNSSTRYREKIKQAKSDSQISIGEIELIPIANGSSASCLGLLFTFLILLLITIILLTVLKPMWDN